VVVSVDVAILINEGDHRRTLIPERDHALEPGRFSG
jgi:hypothetical protein